MNFDAFVVPADIVAPKPLVIVVPSTPPDIVDAATVDVNVYGSTSNSSTLASWEIMDTVTISNANFDATTYAHVYDVDAKGLAPYMKIGLDPSANLGAVDIRVAVITGGGGRSTSK